MIAAIPALLLTALTAATPDIGVTANIRAGKLSPGREYKISLTIDLPEGLATKGSGVPAPLLQIEVPDCVELTGKHLTTYKQLASNEFLQAPYELLLKRKKTFIGFKLLKQPTPGDAINLNIVAYVSDSSGDKAHFIRKRFALPVAAGATATPVDTINSHWGTQDLLDIGDVADDFTLPSLTTGNATLSQYRGKKNVVITTYRAYW